MKAATELARIEIKNNKYYIEEQGGFITGAVWIKEILNQTK